MAMTASSGWNQSLCPRKKNKFGWRFGWKTPAPRAVPLPDSTGTRCSAGRISCFVGPWSSRSSKSAPPAAPDADEKRRENSRETVALAVRIHRHRSPLLLLPRSLSLPLFFLSLEIPSPSLSSLSFFSPFRRSFHPLVSSLDYFRFSISFCSGKDRDERRLLAARVCLTLFFLVLLAEPFDRTPIKFFETLTRKRRTFVTTMKFIIG